MQNHGWALEYVPKEFIDREMCLAAVKNYGLCLEHVPMEFRDFEMCLSAFSNYRRVLEDIPMELRKDVIETSARKRVETIHDFESLRSFLRDCTVEMKPVIP